MIRKWIVTGAGLLWIALGIGSGAAKLWAAPQAPAAQAKPGYTLPEYNAYKAADAEQNPQQKVKMLDDFVKTYNNSTLMPYIYRDYYTTYMALKNYAQAIEYADRMIALGDRLIRKACSKRTTPAPRRFIWGCPTRRCKLPMR